MSLDFIWTYGKHLIFLQFLLSLVLCVMVFRYPELLVRMLQRWWIFKTGFSVKRMVLDKGVIVEYMERGSLEDCNHSLLLVHGFTSTKDSFCRFANFLPKRMHIVALDLPGHGGSSYTDDDHILESIVNRIKQFCISKQLDCRKFHIVGISLGGLIAGLYAQKHEKDLLSTTFMCPAGIKKDQMPLLKKLYQKRGKFALLPETNEEFMALYDMLLYKKVHLPNVLVSGIMQMRLKSHDFFMKVALDLKAKELHSVLGESLHEIKTPTLVLWGSHDLILDVSSLDVFKEKLPQAKLEVIENCGHTIILERPRKSASVVTEFINSFD